MSIIFKKLKAHAQEFEKILSTRAFLLDETSKYSWTNKVYKSAWTRRAHLDVIDVSETKNLFMMHICVFPHVYDRAPIYGFDIIAGPSKITGAFLDYSPIGDPDHALCKYFQELVEPTQWSKPRELPAWAQNIFSNQMVAAGNINSEFELDVVLELSKKSLVHYMDNIKTHRPPLTYDDQVKLYNFTEQQNYYCQQQKCNPHTPRVLKSLGFTEEVAHDFIHTELFPEIS
ncbi:phycocyanobilin:ferredoxin oxidoreductase [uncultured Caudovirales phage]|uniref:Phycocyanobilin:ferredoxin oxidoreductase n=1 Tax=uncultured Caudovirales phage TaxID=2100421 RepID=A0A6J7WQG0_9CAUD|nr:phycocyanobilin:ferredoxin oxidoreductase [uncultured Caudovirales phage]